MLALRELVLSAGDQEGISEFFTNYFGPNDPQLVTMNLCVRAQGTAVSMMW